MIKVMFPLMATPTATTPRIRLGYHHTLRIQSKLRYCCKEIHYLHNTEETGYVVGGSEPTASATAIAVYFLQVRGWVSCSC